MSKYSPAKSDFVTGKLSNDFPSMDLRILRAIADAALNYGLIFDADARLGRLDSAEIRTDSDTDTGSTSGRKPAPSSLQQKRQDAEEAIKNMHKNPRTMPHERLKKTDNGPAMPQTADTRTADEAKRQMQEAILNQHKGAQG